MAGGEVADGPSWQGAFYCRCGRRLYLLKALFLCPRSECPPCKFRGACAHGARVETELTAKTRRCASGATAPDRGPCTCGGAHVVVDAPVPRYYCNGLACMASYTHDELHRNVRLVHRRVYRPTETPGAAPDVLCENGTSLAGQHQLRRGARAPPGVARDPTRARVRAQCPECGDTFAALYQPRAHDMRRVLVCVKCEHVLIQDG